MIDSKENEIKQLLTKGFQLIETDRASSICLGNASCVIDMLAMEQPNFFFIVKPRVKLLFALTASVL